MLDLNPVQMVILGAIAVLLFGERLPEVARSMGKQLVQYKRAIQGIREQVTSVINDSASTSSMGHGGVRPIFEDHEEHEEATAPKFELPPPEPASDPLASGSTPTSPLGGESEQPPESPHG